MTGSEFLIRVSDLYPRTVRILMSGNADLDSVTTAVNHGAVYKFLAKPWQDELFLDTVRKALRQYGDGHFKP